MSEGLPDVILGDLASCRFHVKRRPEGFSSQTTAFNSCLQAFSPDMLVSRMHTWKGQKFCPSVWVSIMLLTESRKQYPICLGFVFLLTQPCVSRFFSNRNVSC